MASTSDIVRRYFEALSAHEIERAVALWRRGGVERIAGQQELVAPDGLTGYFEELFAAFPDFTFEVVDTTTYRNRCAIRWRATGTFAGPGRFQGFAPNGARIQVSGCDVITVSDERIDASDVYMDSADVARQLGMLPAVGSRAEARLAALANLRTRLRQALRGAQPEIIAPGVWIVRGGRPRLMNAYLIEDDGGVTLFDAGTAEMSGALRAAAARFGGIRRVVLGHADCDHRGGAAGLDAPVYCHSLEAAAAHSPASLRDYWDLSRLSQPARSAYPWLLRHWDGGALEVTGTVQEGTELAGFRVIELPGHAPGLIGLFRESDRLALVSDCLYTVNPESGRRQPPSLPHPAFNQDGERGRESIRRLAALNPSIVWTGHGEPLAGDDVVQQLELAAGDPAPVAEAIPVPAGATA